jgi:lysine/ornithine N-monooxygenase
MLTAVSPDARALISHSADHRDFAQFAGRDVTVIGRGQSGLETAALLREEGATVRLLARAPTIEWNPDLEDRPSLTSRLRHPESALGAGWHSLFYSEYPRVFHRLLPSKRRQLVTKAHIPAGAWWLKRRVAGKLPLLTSHQPVAIAARNGRLDLTVRSDRGTGQIATDHVIAATGYRIDLDRLPFLSSALRGAIRTVDGAPVLNTVFESSMPGLHFVGLASLNSFGPVMRFVYGARHAAAIIGRHLGAAKPRRAKAGSALNERLSATS